MLISAVQWSESAMRAWVLSHFSCVHSFVTPWTVACQAPLSMEFSRQEYWSVLPCTPSGDLPNPKIQPASFMSPALAGEFFTTSTTWSEFYIPSILDPLLHHPTCLGHHRAPSWAPCARQQAPTSYFTHDIACRKWKWKSFSGIQLFLTPWAVQSMEFSRPEYWSG